MQEKEFHEKKDEQLRLLVESSSAQQGAAKEERSAWLAQLDKAEAVAQDARQALVQKQDYCQELEHTLAEVKGELAMCKQNKADSDKEVEQLLADLKISQVTLAACESDLEESKMLLMEKQAAMFACEEQRSMQQVCRVLTMMRVFHCCLLLHEGVGCRGFAISSCENCTAQAKGCQHMSLVCSAGCVAGSTASQFKSECV